MIGSLSVPLMKCIICLFYPVTKPLSMALDFLLGQELATTYSNGEMTKLLQLHVQHNVMDHDTAQAMTGALTYKQILVKDVMTPMERTFLLDVDEKLSFETMAKIFKSGYSRIPVYEVSRVRISRIRLV
jgi:metal transporter CNNM